MKTKANACSNLSLNLADTPNRDTQKTKIANNLITAYYQNIRGVNGIVNKLFKQMHNTHFDIIALTETFLKDSVSSSEIFPAARFETYRCDRINKVGGGVCLAVKDPDRFKILPIKFNKLREAYDNIDIIGIDIQGLNNSTISIILLYIPPHLCVEYFQTFLTELAVYLLNKENILVMGDFNVRSFISNDLNVTKCRAIFDFFNTLDIAQVNAITNCDNVLLDLVAATPRLNCAVVQESEPFSTIDKFHPPLAIELISTIERVKCFPAQQSFRSYNFRKANLSALYNDIQCAEWHKIHSAVNVNAMCEMFYGILYKILDDNVPLRNVNRTNYPVWYTAEIIAKLKEKSKLHTQYKKSRREEDLSNFKKLRVSCKHLVDSAFNQYISTVESTINTQPNLIWHFINGKKRSTRIPGRMNHNGTYSGSQHDIVEMFAKYFSSVYLPPSNVTADSYNKVYMPNVSLETFTTNQVKGAIKKLSKCNSVGDDEVPYFLIFDCAEILADPLTAIFNRSVNTCEFPSIWKIGRVVPIHKSGDKSLISNYRPISLLSCFAKVYERLLFDQIFPQIKQYLSPLQHGFYPKRSTNTNLAIFNEFVSTALDQQVQVDAIYTDFSKAFDTIDVSIVTNKLRDIGFHDNALGLFHSYLVDREQYVFYNGTRSSSYKPTSGVPQGSNLGPLIFLIFINDLPETLTCQTLMFADDVKLYKKITSLNDCTDLQQDLNKLSEWCNKNRLKLNTDKCKILTFTRRCTRIQVNYNINNSILSRVHSTCDLGVIFSSDLKFNEHINATAGKAVRTLGFLLRNCSEFKNTSMLKQIYISLVRPILEYATVIWSPSTSSSITILESVQRRFMKFLHFKNTHSYPPRGYPNELLLTETGLNSLEARRNYFDALFGTNLLNNTTDCGALLELLNFRIPRESSRNKDIFYIDTYRTSAKQESTVSRILKELNNISETVDIASVNKVELRKVYFKL